MARRRVYDVSDPHKPKRAASRTAPGASSHFVSEVRTGQYRTSKLIGLDVYSADEKIGDISDLFVDREGKIEAVVIGVGGFLGIGEHDVAVPLGQIRFVDEPPGGTTNRSVAANPPGNTHQGDHGTCRREPGLPDYAMLNMTNDQLKAAPAIRYSR